MRQGGWTRGGMRLEGMRRGGIVLGGLLLAGGVAMAQPNPGPAPGSAPSGPNGPAAPAPAPGMMGAGPAGTMPGGPPPGSAMQGGPMQSGPMQDGPMQAGPMRGGAMGHGPMGGPPLPTADAASPPPASAMGSGGPFGLGLAGALSQAPALAAAAAAATTSFPVYAVTGVEVLRSSQSPKLDLIVVQGVISSEGWDRATLIPLTSGPSADGVLDMVLVAAPPERTMAPSGWAPIQAVLPVSDHPFQAIRVRGATNAITLKEVPGHAAVKAPADPCGTCIGKHLLAKGAAAPNGVSATDVVREEDLPAGTRIIRPTDGISDMRGNPNRLTLVVGEDGRIVDAAWE